MATKNNSKTSQIKSEEQAKEKISKKSSKKLVIYAMDESATLLKASEPEIIYNYQPFYTDDISLLNNSKKGLNAKAALDFLSLSGFTQDEFQETFKTTVKTIQNHVTKDLTLDAALSEKLLKSFALFDKGVEIFGSAKNFHRWLATPAYGLGNQLPFDLMDTITGIQLIEEELIRIEFGDLA
ncbi:MAG TPA: MbcA/ParS/Xre antitoxin family protein [Mucilaginibacter sp.]|jgi:putative toxin-antitoxin system antitoxin component (TIGR02293 family)